MAIRGPQRAFIVLAVACWAAFTPLRAAQESEQDRRLTDALRAFIPRVMHRNGTPGLNIALARRGRIIWEEGFGLADIGSKRPMTRDTVMHSGSMGKLYTATAVMQLVEQGIVALDDPIDEHLPVEVTNPLGGGDVTIEDLLTHRSGLSTNAGNGSFGTPRPLAEHVKEGYARGKLPELGGTLVPVWGAPVGERFQYSNFGLTTLGYLVEVANPEDLTFPEYVQRHVMDPLGMASGRFPPVQDAEHLPPEIVGEMSAGYTRFGSVLLPTPHVQVADYPAGTAVFTPGDHLRLLLAFMNGGALDGHRVLESATVDEMLRPHVEHNAVAGLGLIWFLGNMGRDDAWYGHDGAFMFGWRNGSRAYPELDFAVVVATNQWELGQSGNDAFVHDSTLIANFIARWIRGEASAPEEPSTRSWEWKTSYVIGLMTGEQLRFHLGIADPITESMLDDLCAGATTSRTGVSAADMWDEGGFRAGIDDMQAAATSLGGIRAFLASTRLKVPQGELELICRQLGRDGLPWTWGTR